MSAARRCINLDWLEVYCLEPIDQPHDPDYYRGLGMEVDVRDYGTPQYKQMFTIRGEFGYGVIEVRRDPKQAEYENAILPINATHIRLTNRACYARNAVQELQAFLERHHYTLVRIFRIDLCLDFVRFDSGDDPQSFVHRYIKRKYSKINQAEGHGHFTDRWDGRHWNSISWGKAVSAVTTKLYNKSLELMEVHDKPYIKQSWFESGLIDHPIDCYKLQADGQRRYPTIWRLEFSIKSKVKNWTTIEYHGEEKKLRSIPNRLDVYDTEDKMLTMFASLCEHYFHFKHFQYGVLKSKCPDKVLFKFDKMPVQMRVEHPASPQREDNELLRLRKYLMRYRLVHFDPQVTKAIDNIVERIDAENLRRYTANPANTMELRALQLAIARRIDGDRRDIFDVLHEIEADLKNGQELF